MIVAAAGGGGVTWLVALVPTLSLTVAFVTAWAATYPQRKDRRDQAQLRAAREERLDACADVVLGRPADPNRGQPEATPGLAEVVNQHTKLIRDTADKIGTTRDGRPLAQVLEEALGQVQRIGTAQREAAETMEAQRGVQIEQGNKMEAHERRLGRQDERLNDHDKELREVWRANGGRPARDTRPGD